MSFVNNLETKFRLEPSNKKSNVACLWVESEVDNELETQQLPTTNMLVWHSWEGSGFEEPIT